MRHRRDRRDRGLVVPARRPLFDEVAADELLACGSDPAVRLFDDETFRLAREPVIAQLPEPIELA